MQPQTLLYIVICVFAVVSWPSFAAKSDDEIVISQFNTTLYIANETYQFVLIPKYQVPLQVYRHIIYTASSATITQLTKRAFWQNKKRLYELAPEDHELLANYMGDELPSYVKVNQKKRSLPPDDSGFRTIALSEQVAVLVSPGPVSQKRDGTILGGTLCLHVPFFTSCDDSSDIANVKTVLQTQVDSFRTELDSYKATNDARANEMAVVLDKQRVLIQKMANQLNVNVYFLDSVTSAVSTNAAQLAHGDYLAHAQINYIKRLTNSLLRYSNALASTDPRSVVAQPSLTELFTGYLKVLSFLQTNTTPGYMPIVDTRTFNWTENPLPAQSVSNITTTGSLLGGMAFQIQNLVGFRMVTTLCCLVRNLPDPYICNSSMTYVGSPAMRDLGLTPAGDQWTVGPFAANHVGVYPIAANTGETIPTVSYSPVFLRPIQGYRLAGTHPRIDDTDNSVSQLYCVDFLGYKVLATFNSTKNMLNGIPSPTVSPLSDCNNYLLRTNPVSPGKTYFLFGIQEGVLIPFYSNCDPITFSSETRANITIGYLAAYTQRNQTSTTSISADLLYTIYDVNARHWVSPNCFMNLEPDWLGLSYYFSTQPTVIPNIPRGYKLNQFTINPQGELSSSLEFVYTSQWAWVYSVQLVSNNTVIVDEVSALDGSSVLFHLSGTTIVDESDSFYGQSNNGRDCIQAAATYDYDLTACFFQNDETSYSVDQYLVGNVATTGIARYVNKFSFALDAWNTTMAGAPVQSYRFALTPKDTADFSYSIQYDGPICPKLLQSSSSLTGCTYLFYYSGEKTLNFGTSFAASTVMHFDNNNISTQSVSFAASETDLSRSIYVDGAQCLLVKCSYSSSNVATSSVEVLPTSVQLVSAADLALAGKVSFALDQTFNSTLASMQAIKDKVAQSHQNLSRIIDALGALDFNVTRIVPYQDFSDLRAQVDSMISDLSPSGSSSCGSGVFGSVVCWFEQAANTLIVIGIIAAIAVGIYCVCFKFGLAKKLCGK